MAITIDERGAKVETNPYGHNNLDSRAERDKINEALRASDLWRNAIKGMGLNPDGPLKLTSAQQKQLASTIGLSTEDFHIDGAGNINDYHGWKGLPTAAKVAIIVGAAVATAGAAGAFSGGAGAASAAGTGGTLASSSLPTAALMGGAPAITSGAVSTGIGLGTSGTVASLGGGGAAAKFGWDALKNKVKDFAGPAGAMLVNGADASAHNRGVQLDASLEQEKLRQSANRDFMDQMIARSAENRAGQSDAWKKLQQSGYVSNWTQPTAKFSPYTADLKAPSLEVVQGANALRDQTRDSLMSGRFNADGTPLPTPTDRSGYTLDPTLLTGSQWERLQGYVGSGLGAYDAISRKPRKPTA